MKDCGQHRQNNTFLPISRLFEVFYGHHEAFILWKSSIEKGKKNLVLEQSAKIHLF